MQQNRALIRCLITTVISLFIIDRCQSTPLDDYVNVPDSHLAWHVIQTYSQPDYVLYILNFTSQQWFDGEFDKTNKLKTFVLSQKHFQHDLSGGIFYALLYLIASLDQKLLLC